VSEITAVGSQGSATDTNTQTTKSPIDQLANKQTFLQLLVAQIKNQDPLKPTDGTAFVGQLAQFSELEQLIGIRGTLDTMNTRVEQAAGEEIAGTDTGSNN
jgi:flagellar basal-body rod modification protein FlgD